MVTWEDEQLGELRAVFIGWDIWAVRRVVQATLWCARPKGAEIAMFHADSPAELSDQIREYEKTKAK